MHFREFAQTVARSSLEANTLPCLLMCDLCKLVSVFMRDKLSTYSKLCELSKHCLRGARIFALFTLYKPLHDFQADSTLCCRFAPSLTSSIDINLPCVVQVKRPKRASMTVSNEVARGLLSWKKITGLGKVSRVVEWWIVHGYQLVKINFIPKVEPQFVLAICLKKNSQTSYTLIDFLQLFQS